MTKRNIIRSSVIMLAVSLLPFIYHTDNAVVLSFAYMFFMTGLGFICDRLTYIFSGNSFLTDKKIAGKTAGLFAFSALVALIMEVSGNFIGNFWYYPYYSAAVYFLMIIFNFFTYSFLLLESFWAARSLIGRARRPVESRVKNKGLAGLFNLMWIPAIGFILSAAGYQKFTGPVDGMINSPKINYAPLYLFVFFAVCLWLFFESRSRIKKGETVLFELFEGNATNLYSVLIASIVISILFEVYNLRFQFWVYDNVPFDSVKIIGIPAAVFVFWPLQYLAIVPFYSFFNKTFEFK